MANDTTRPWVPPDASVFDFANCTLASSWVVAILRNKEDWSTYSTYNIFVDALNQYWIDSNVSEPTLGEMIDWLGEVDDAWPLEAMFQFALEHCRAQLCAAWDGKGTPTSLVAV
jgi:hypothetical protein